MTFDEAKAYLSDKHCIIRKEDGNAFNGSYGPHTYLSVTPGAKHAALDGHFSAEDLFAIAAYLKGP